MKVYVVKDGSDDISEAFSTRSFAEEALSLKTESYGDYYEIWELEIDKFVNSSCKDWGKFLVDALREISAWSQEDQDDHEICSMQWRGCVDLARSALAKYTEKSGRISDCQPRRRGMKNGNDVGNSVESIVEESS